MNTQPQQPQPPAQNKSKSIAIIASGILTAAIVVTASLLLTMRREADLKTQLDEKVARLETQVASLQDQVDESEPTITSDDTATTDTSDTSTNSSTADTEGVYENSYFSIELQDGWEVEERTEGQIAITNTTTSGIPVLLEIDPRRQQSSGIAGGRFSEAADGVAGAELVDIDGILEDYCGDKSEALAISNGFQPTGLVRIDYTIDEPLSSVDQGNCTPPSDGENHWFLSIVTDAERGGPLGDLSALTTTATDPGVNFVITMTADVDDVDDLPIEGTSTAEGLRNEMTLMAASIDFK